MSEGKTIKQLAKEAKMRLKSGYWQNYHETIKTEIEKQGAEGVRASKVVQYYAQKAQKEMRGIDPNEEAFYQKVKILIQSEGEVSDAIGRLTDKEYYETLSYEQKQRYTLDLSRRYREALQRYYRELEFEA